MNYPYWARLPLQATKIAVCLLFCAWALHSLAANRNEPIQPLPEVKLDQEKVALGSRLFHDHAFLGITRYRAPPVTA